MEDGQFYSSRSLVVEFDDLSTLFSILPDIRVDGICLLLMAVVSCLGS